MMGRRWVTGVGLINELCISLDATWQIRLSKLCTAAMGLIAVCHTTYFIESVNVGKVTGKKLIALCADRLAMTLLIAEELARCLRYLFI